MYNNAAPPRPNCYPNQPPPAGYPRGNQGHQSSVAPTRMEYAHAVRYAHGPTQPSYSPDLPASGLSTFPARPQHVPSYTSAPPASSRPSDYQPHPAPQYPPASAPSTAHGGSSQQAGHPPSVHSAVYPIDTYTVSNFLSDTLPGAGTCPFAVDKNRPTMLQVNFGSQSSTGYALQQVFMKKESVVAYRGEINFELEGETEQGKYFRRKRGTAGRASLVKATSSGGGRSQLHLADSNKMITVLQLNGESITVNGDDLLAFEPSLFHRTVMMKELCTNYSGGLFSVQLNGKGCVALISRGKPLTLSVQHGQPTVYTDPEATVAWSGVNPDFNTDVQLKGIFGHRGGESIQMKFDPNRGEGFVVVQPYEEIAPHNRGGLS